jgi:hypothetical protein
MLRLPGNPAARPFIAGADRVTVQHGGSPHRTAEGEALCARLGPLAGSVRHIVEAIGQVKASMLRIACWPARRASGLEHARGAPSEDIPQR